WRNAIALWLRPSSVAALRTARAERTHAVAPEPIVEARSRKTFFPRNRTPPPPHLRNQTNRLDRAAEWRRRQIPQPARLLPPPRRTHPCDAAAPDGRRRL